MPEVWRDLKVVIGAGSEFRLAKLSRMDSCPDTYSKGGQSEFFWAILELDEGGYPPVEVEKQLDSG